MAIRILFILLLLVVSSTSHAQTRRAIVIGIGKHEDKTWGKINGDKDVPYVEEMLVNCLLYTSFQLTVNVTACCIVFVGALVGKDSPLTVTQMLWINLIMDTFGAMALASLPPSKDVMKDKPRKRGSEHVNKIGNWAYFKE